MKLTQNLNVSKYSARDEKHDAMRQRNICILYGFLAEKLAGEFFTCAVHIGVFIAERMAKIKNYQFFFSGKSSAFILILNVSRYRRNSDIILCINFA